MTGIRQDKTRQDKGKAPALSLDSSHTSGGLSWSVELCGLGGPAVTLPESGGWFDVICHLMPRARPSEPEKLRSHGPLQMVWQYDGAQRRVCVWVLVPPKCLYAAPPQLLGMSMWNV